MAIKISNSTIIDDSRNIINATNAQVTGISTLGNVRISSGIVTATTGIVTYYGDGSNLTGIQGGLGISTNTTNQAQYIPYATSFGSTTGAGATALFVYNPSTTRLGIGTTNPQHNLHVIGDFVANTYLYSHISLGNISGITTINLNTATSFSATVTGITTFQFTNPTGLTASRSIDFVIQLTNGGSYAITFPTSVNWENGVTPTLTGVGTDLIGFFTNNTGTDWTGSLLLKDIR